MYKYSKLPREIINLIDNYRIDNKVLSIRRIMPIEISYNNGWFLRIYDENSVLRPSDVKRMNSDKKFYYSHLIRHLFSRSEIIDFEKDFEKDVRVFIESEEFQKVMMKSKGVWHDDVPKHMRYFFEDS